MMAPPEPSSGPSSTMLSLLPQEMVEEICVHLPAKEKARLARSSRTLYHKVLPSLYLPEIASKDESVIWWACEADRLGTVEILLQTGLDPNQPERDPYHLSGSRGFVPLEAAALHGRRAIAELLLRHGADVNSRRGRSTPLLEVISAGKNACADNNMAKLFLDSGADPNLTASDKRFKPPSLEAIGRGNIAVLELLLDHGAHVNSDTKPPLRHAIRCAVPRDEEIIRLLLQRGADPNLVVYDDDRFRSTPLITAIFRCLMNAGRRPFAILSLLISHGADVNLVLDGDDGPQPPIYHAIGSYVDPRTLHLLLSSGANPNLAIPRATYAMTPLHKAMDPEQEPTYAEMLLDAGARPVPPSASPNESRSTPLGELISLHLKEGRVDREWRVDRDWVKVCLLIEHGGADVITHLPAASLVVLLSLSVSACRTTRQYREHLADVSLAVQVSVPELFALTQQPEYLAIWRDDQLEELPGAEFAKKGATILGEMLQEMDGGDQVSKTTQASG